MCEWIMWKDEQPRGGEASYVIFKNLITGLHWMHYGTALASTHWYDNEPVAWTPKPKMPDWAVKPTQY